MRYFDPLFLGGRGFFFLVDAVEGDGGEGPTPPPSLPSVPPAHVVHKHLPKLEVLQKVIYPKCSKIPVGSTII